MSWADKYRVLKVKTNANTPKDAKQARSFEGHTVHIERGVGARARIPDDDYREAGADLVDAEAAWTGGAGGLHINGLEVDEGDLRRPLSKSGYWLN